MHWHHIEPMLEVKSKASMPEVKHTARHPMCRRYSTSVGGFTLIELIVTIAIASTLMVVAVPSFIAFQRNAHLSDAVSNFIAAANTARSNAMKQGYNTYLIPTDSGTDWRVGWIVFTDKNWNNTYDSATDEIILSHDALNSNVTVSIPTTNSFGSGYLLFNGSGFPRMKTGGFSGATMVMSNTNRSSSIIVDPAGRVRSCKTGSTGC